MHHSLGALVYVFEKEPKMENAWLRFYFNLAFIE